jgi:3-oxoacyl-[acyl-carrier protein] reductase
MTAQLEGTGVALVTGAARGIGRATALGLAKDGYDIGAVDVNEEALAELAAEVTGKDRRICPVVLDVSRIGEIDAAVTRIAKTLGPISALVNNAGMTRAQSIYDTSEEDWDYLHGINLKGSFFVFQRVVRDMTDAGGGRVVNIASVAALGYPKSSSVAYAASKGGVVAYSRVAAQVLAPSGVLVNVVCPGPTRTDKSEPAAQRRAAQLGIPIEQARKMAWENIPLGRRNEPEDVAGIIRFLLSPAAANITGQVIAVDGGLIP